MGRIAELANRKGGWDGADAEPLSAATIADARRLVDLIPLTRSIPRITPSLDGEIFFTWRRGDAIAVTVSVAGDSNASYAIKRDGRYVPGVQEWRLAAAELPEDFKRIVLEL